MTGCAFLCYGMNSGLPFFIFGFRVQLPVFLNRGAGQLVASVVLGMISMAFDLDEVYMMLFCLSKQDKPEILVFHGSFCAVFPSVFLP